MVFSLVRTDVSEERSTSIIRVKIIGDPGTTLALKAYLMQDKNALYPNAYCHLVFSEKHQ
jgi:hypothetical protein